MAHHADPLQIDPVLEQGRKIGSACLIDFCPIADVFEKQPPARLDIASVVCIDRIGADRDPDKSQQYLASLALADYGIIEYLHDVEGEITALKIKPLHDYGESRPGGQRRRCCRRCV